jgi:hypothetical protein
MFLYDSNTKPIFPEDAGKRPVVWTSTCIAFSVLSYVDGDAKVTLCDAPDERHDNEYFADEIRCPSKAISLYDHNGFAFASVPLKDSFARMSLRMSEISNPDFVTCVIENMETF